MKLFSYLKKLWDDYWEEFEEYYKEHHDPMLEYNHEFNKRI